MVNIQIIFQTVHICTVFFIDKAIFLFFIENQIMRLTKQEIRFMKLLGKRLVALRKERGLMQKEVADILDIADSSLRRIEYGKTNPTTTTLLNLAKALDITLSELFDFNSIN